MDLTQFEVGKELGQNSGSDDGVDEALLAEVMQGEDTHAVDISEEKTVQAGPLTVETGRASCTTEGAELIGKHNQIVFLNETGKDGGQLKEDADEVEKRKQRAKRFGLFDADLEEEKRITRARRFGLPVAEDEIMKLKTRAKRFGIPLPEEEEKKKKQRAARFGLPALAGLSDEEKLKRRAERFK